MAIQKSGQEIAYRKVIVNVFDTCTNKCAYCYWAESGLVLDSSQLHPFRDKKYINKIADFFNKRTNNRQKWLLLLSGGEPLLMPNFDHFIEQLAGFGNRFKVYTALHYGSSQRNYRFMLENPGSFDSIMASFHEESEKDEDAYMSRIMALKSAGHSVILKLVAHPKRLCKAALLAEKCKDMDVAFYLAPMVLQSGATSYPRDYTAEERTLIDKFIVTKTQSIIMQEGVDTSKHRCFAGSSMLGLYLYTGDISPCITTANMGIDIGNIYEDTLQLVDGQYKCPENLACTCEDHYFQDTFVGITGSEEYALLKKGWVEPDPVPIKEKLKEEKLSFADAPNQSWGVTPQGIGHTSLSRERVQSTYRKSLHYFSYGRRETYHREFRDRMPTVEIPLPSRLTATVLSLPSRFLSLTSHRIKRAIRRRVQRFLSR